MLIFVLIAPLVVFFCIYLYFKYSYTYWKRKGVPYIEPKFPLGNNEVIGFEQFSYGLETVEWYKDFRSRGVKLGGIWSWSRPALLITDTEYIKDVLLKEFHYFSTRDFFHNPADPRISSLFVAKGDEWKNLRQKLTPVFTSAKMKTMFGTAVACTKPMIDLIEGASKTSSDVEIREVLASFATDVIGCIAFGLEFGSFSSPDAKFRQMGREFFKSTPLAKLSLVLSRISPDFAKLVGISTIPEIVTDFFADVITDNVKYRKEKGVVKPDITQALMDLHDTTKNEQNGFSFTDFIANLILFFIAGFDTSSTTMHFALYELARNTQLQNRAREEILRVLSKHEGQLTYEAFQEMTYLRQVVDETLRMYPPVPALARECVQDFKFKDSNFTVEKGSIVVIPAFALSRDPEHFPKPDVFDPERFSLENKASINSYAYLPFSEGPRNCIGKRFGIMQSSVGLIRILKDFKVSISEKTKMPLTLRRGIFLMQTNETLFLKFQKV